MKYKKFYIITLIILIIVYLFWIYQYNFCTINMHIISSLILFFPIFIVGLMYLLSKKEKLSYNVALGISITQIIIFLILNFITFIFILINEGISYEDNPYSVFKDKDCDEFFSSCMIFLLESEPYKNNDWNHGYVSYIAKNERILDMIPYNLKWLRNKISNRLEDYIVSIDNECSYFCKKYYLIGLKDGIKLKKELEM